MHSQQKYIFVRTGQALAKAIKPFFASLILGIDSETTGLNPYRDKLVLVQIAAPNLKPLIIDILALTPKQLEPLQRLLAGKALKIFHNGKFDYQFLYKSGLKLSRPFFDTQLAHQVLKAGLKKSHSLQALVRKYLGVILDKTEQTGRWDRPLTSKQRQYAATDASVLLELQPILERLLEAAKLTAIALVEFALMPVVAKMELNGMLLDTSKMETLRASLEAQKQQLQQEIQQTLKPKKSQHQQLSLFPEITDVINPRSPEQVLNALVELGVPISSTNKNVLIPLQSEYPIIKTLLEYRKCSTLISTFVEPLPSHIEFDGRIHPSYRQCGARSGRFSCRNPNLQNIPRDKSIRSCFVARPGYAIIRADYSQIELRIVAFLCRDRRMRQAYLNGEDLHTLTASLITGKALATITPEDRQMAKAINFGLIYGMGAGKLKIYAETEYGVLMTLKQAKLFRRRFFQAYPGLRKWHQKIKTTIYDLALKEIKTIHGRRRRWSTNPRLSELFNHPVQGTSADLLKIALCDLDIAIDGTGALLISTVHDEIILECPLPQVERVSQILEKCMLAPAEAALHPIPVKVEIKVGNSWAA